MLTQERLKKLLRYSPVVGVFERRVGNGSRARPFRWKLAGTVHPDGYVYISLEGVLYKAHRLAWLYVFGEIPNGDLDHKDGDRSNNAISNLRLATQHQNMWNSQKLKSNSSGVKGVSFDKSSGKWVGRIKAQGKIVFNQYFDSLEQAQAEIERFREKVHGEYANHGVHKYKADENR